LYIFFCRLLIGKFVHSVEFLGILCDDDERLGAEADFGVQGASLGVQGGHQGHEYGQGPHDGA
jgi:hypothetical protein